MLNQNELRLQVTNDIVAALEAGTPPWRKPWAMSVNAGSPINAASKRRYSGINPLLLEMTSQRMGFRSRHWATYRQWQQLGCQVKRRPSDVPAGRWGTTIVFYAQGKATAVNKEGHEEERVFPILRSYSVFNADQVDGAERFQVEEVQAEPVDFIDYSPADEAIAAVPADIRFGGDRAYYQRGTDFIQMPHKHQFKEESEFYGTAFHELAHWSECRLGWDGSYALGELRAEIASCYALAELKVPMASDMENHHAYLANWLEAMRGDPRLIFQIASAASKATDYLLSFSQEPAAVVEEAMA
jgi:antirestriction protein ArdC